MSNSLAGRSAVVTGAARGIGDAIAERLLDDGARVFSLDKLAPEEPRAGVVYLEADVTDPSSVAQAFKSIDAKTDAIDILVNNAGIQRVGLVGKISFAEWSAVVATHLNGFFLCASEVVPRMVARGKGGAIVSIASTAAFVGLAGTQRLLRCKGRHTWPYTSARARGRVRRHSGECRCARFHPNQIGRAGIGRRVIARGLDGRAGSDEAPCGHPGDRERRTLSRRGRSVLRDRPDDHRGRRLDGPGHTARAGLAANPCG